MGEGDERDVPSTKSQRLGDSMAPDEVSELDETANADTRHGEAGEDSNVRLKTMLSMIDGARDGDLTLTLPQVVSYFKQHYQELNDATPTNITNAEFETIFFHINRSGLKRLAAVFLRTRPEFNNRVIYRHAEEEWWKSRYILPDVPMLNLQMEKDGTVVVDLWHARRGIGKTPSFKNFESAFPTFFMGSLGYLEQNVDSITDYIGEADPESDDPEETTIYVKRGRFRFKPLLWFSDKNVSELRKNTSKAKVVAGLLNSHRLHREANKDFSTESDKMWKKALYYRPSILKSGERIANELRLDNNCVDEASIPLDAGFQGTLAVDVSGLAGANGPPGIAAPDTESVVLWDVPNTLVDEGPWEPMRVEIS